MENKHANAIKHLNVYKFGDQWVFDDAAVGLDKEPFVAGADTLIDKLAPPNERKVGITFSDNFFPTHDFTVDMVKDDSHINAGTYYHCEELKHDLWLCPALLKYFKTPPNKIYFKIK